MSTIKVRVKDAMDSDLVFVDEDVNANEAIKKMVESKVWSILITSKGKPVGVMTERDFIRRCIIPGLEPSKTPISKLMSQPLVTIRPDASLGEAMTTMADKKIRRLYVIDGGKIIGRITQTGLMYETLEVFQAFRTAMTTL